MAKKINLIGQKFGKLTVIEEAPSKRVGKQMKTQWKCKCECGGEKIVRTDWLKNGYIKSCGSKKDHQNFGSIGGQKNIEKLSINEINKKYGKLTVIEKDYEKSGKNKGSFWICRCECGTIISVSGSCLRNNLTKSCGCTSSFGEEKIAKILKENNIHYEKEKVFDTCVFPDTGKKARFDFYINNSYIIEFDGIQHFKSGTGWNTEEKFLKTKEHDKYKNDWAKKNNIPLIRIPYYKIDDLTIEDLIYKELSEKDNLI